MYFLEKQIKSIQFMGCQTFILGKKKLCPSDPFKALELNKESGTVFGAAGLVPGSYQGTRTGVPLSTVPISLRTLGDYLLYYIMAFTRISHRATMVRIHPTIP